MPDDYPLLQYQFYLEITGVSVAQFTEVGGLNMEREVKQVPQGGVNDHIHSLPGRVKYSDITLKRGLTYSYDLWVWFQQGLYDLKVVRKDVSIFQLDKSGQCIRRWDVARAFPTKYTVSDLNATS
ncbi:MAG: phage tail protein, partial [Anaerolineales bacterium]|nr:phage tail protein [Anaerolineales bacterium]